MKKLVLLIVALAVILIGGTLLGAYYYDQYQNYIKTDDAKVQGDLMTIGTLATGQLQSWNVNTGDSIHKGDILGKVLIPAGTTVDITAPADGTIIESKATAGQIVAPGVPLAMSADLSKLYVTANILETDLQDVKVGHEVTIKVDAITGVTFNGRVDGIGLATTSTFSVLPADNSSGNYTKVTQRVPVRIAFTGYEGKTLIPGLNANVKISK